MSSFSYDNFYDDLNRAILSMPSGTVKIERDVKEGDLVFVDEVDLINHPPHYAEGRQFEPIDVIFDWNLNYAEGNVVKYISRWRRKGGLEDLKKAQFYMNKLVEVEEKSLENSSD